jgi:hypothetical protein
MRKSSFLTFMFAFMPGAGQMYLGLMKKGASIMALFVGTICVVGFLNLEVLLFAVPVIWFYSFFDAINYNNMPYEKKVLIEDSSIVDFNMLSDKYHKASSGNNNVILGAFFVVFGVYIVFNKVVQPVLREFVEFSPLLERMINNLPTLFIAFAIIILGLRLVNNKKSEIEDLRDDYKEFGKNNDNR